MDSIGQRLRQERLRRGFDLTQISEQTKISLNLLEAIEAGDVEKLPGSFFTRSFVRQYARALGLDENEFEPELTRLTGFDPSPAAEAQPQRPREEPEFAPVADPLRPGSQHSLGSLIAFLLIVAACSAIYVLWQRTREAPRTPGPSVSAAARPQPASPQPSSPPPQAVTPATFSPAPASAAAPQTAPGESEPAAAPPTETSAVPAPAAPAQDAPVLSTLEAGQPAAVRIEVRATAGVWIRIVADGKFLFSGTLEANQTRVFEGAQGLELRVGNAGALEVVWNGKPVGPLGPQGLVRTVEFTPEAFKILAPLPPKPETPDAEP